MDLKKTEHRRIDAFELWCWKRLLRVPDPGAGKDRRWEKKGTTEDETVGWHHQLNRHEFE